MKRLYFDYSASAPRSLGLSSFLASLDSFKNPSSVHQEGQQARAFLETTRRDLKQLLGAKPQDKLIFTSGGTEANNLVFSSLLCHEVVGKKVIISAVEHAAILTLVPLLEEKGLIPVFLPVSEKGQIDLDYYASLLDEDVGLVSVMLVNNETGFIFPIKEMARMARDKNIRFHTDAIQAIGKMPFNFHELGVDYASWSAHKFGGLTGVGGLLIRDGIDIIPQILGGPQEDSKRAGTENMWGVASAGYALKAVYKSFDDEFQRQQKLRDDFIKALKKKIPLCVVIESDQNVPSILSLAFPKMDGKIIATNLDLEGVAVSFGSACSSGAVNKSHVISVLGLNDDLAHGVIRISFGLLTTKDDFDRLLEIITVVMQRMSGEGS
jgi:cysteine desulfurase